MNNKRIKILIISAIIISIMVIIGIFLFLGEKVGENKENKPVFEVGNVQDDELEGEKNYENMTEEELEQEKTRLIKKIGEPSDKYENLSDEELKAEKDRLLEKVDGLSDTEEMIMD